MPFFPYDVRDKHTHVVGMTGYGKSTLLAWQAYNDILSGEGAVAVMRAQGKPYPATRLAHARGPARRLRMA